MQGDITERDEIVIFDVFLDINEAYLAKARLEGAGIPAFLADENISRILPHLMTGVKLELRKKDIQRALETLGCDSGNAREPGTSRERISCREDWEKEARCPECNSTNIRREPFPLWLLALSLLTFCAPFVLCRRKWRCLACDSKWKK